MSKDTLRDYDSTAANNADVGGVDTSEGMLPSKVNDAIRELMSHLADFSAGTEGIDVLSLSDDDDSAQIKFQAPSAVTTTVTFTLPDGDGTAGQVLETDGSGALSWTDSVRTDENNTFTKAQRGSTDTDTTNTGSVTLDFDANQNFVLTLTGNVTLANPSTEQVGQSGFIVFIQDATGGRTVSLGTDYETAGGAGLTLSSTASTTDIVPYVVAASGRILLGAPQLAFS